MVIKDQETVRKRRFEIRGGRGPRRKRPNERCYGLNELWGALQAIHKTWTLFKKFSSSTSIHGLRYMTEADRPWSERVYWVIAISLCLYYASTSSLDLFKRWHINGDEFKFTGKSMNVWEIPFTAFTICPVGGPSPLNEDYRVNRSLGGEALKSMSKNVGKTIRSVMWRGHRVKASQVFTEVATEEGFCFTFNMLGFKDIFRENTTFAAFENLRSGNLPNSSWNLKDGYHTNTSRTDNYPYRVSGFGEVGGIKFEFVRNVTEVKNSSSHVHGFKLVIHSPDEVPQLDKRYYRFPLEKNVNIVIRPSMMVTENLELYNRTIRQCDFETERDLRYFRSYTNSNCKIECLANFTIEKCGCVHFSLPGSNDTRTCDDTVGSSNCYRDAKRKLMIENMEESLKTSKDFDDRGEPKCKCNPSCTSISYDATISYDDNRYSASRIPVRKVFVNVFSIYFEENEVTYYKPYGNLKSRTGRFVDLLASWCGVYGTYIGISVITFFEIAYFYFFRHAYDDDDYFQPKRN